MKNNKKRVLVLVAAVVVLAAVLAGAWFAFGPKGVKGGKTITFTVIAEGQDNKVHTLTTDAEFLRAPLEEAKLIAGDESEYGLFVKTVDGITADDANQEWWCFTKGGEMLMTGVDSTPIADGEAFEATLTVGW